MSFTVEWFNITGRANFEKYLAKFKGLPDLNFLEIGSYEGLATVWLLQNILTNPTSKIICLDTFEGGMEHNLGNGRQALQLDTLYDRFLENITPYKEKVNVKIGLSQEILRTFPCFPQLDFVYVDGSHQAPDVLEDAILAFRIMKSGGIMIFDDYKWKISEDARMNPTLAIDTFVSVFGGRFKVLESAYQFIIEKL